jgi:hypothetical protein
MWHQISRVLDVELDGFLSLQKGFEAALRSTSSVVIWLNRSLNDID